MTQKKNSAIKRFENFFEQLIFWSRWVQAPMYAGLIFGSIIYLTKFFEELVLMFENIAKVTETEMMLGILALIDITMVINLLVIVVIGGYSIFTSKIDVDHHEDKPLWLEDLDAGQLKIKLAASLASISGVHLLQTFMNIRGAAQTDTIAGIVIEIVIHLVFIISAWFLAITEKTIHSYPHGGFVPVYRNAILLDGHKKKHLRIPETKNEVSVVPGPEDHKD